MPAAYCRMPASCCPLSGIYRLFPLKSGQSCTRSSGPQHDLPKQGRKRKEADVNPLASSKHKQPSFSFNNNGTEQAHAQEHGTKQAQAQAQATLLFIPYRLCETLQ
jgi:hypothetical protein